VNTSLFFLSIEKKDTKSMTKNNRPLSGSYGQQLPCGCPSREMRVDGL
jgi:hypothetical protein